MADCCDDIVGGQVFLTVNDMRFEGSGEALLRPAGVERNAGATAGGRMWVTETARLAEIEMAFFNHCDADPVDNLYGIGRCKMNLTFVEFSRGIRHFFTNASVVGTPQINTATGEVSGMRVVCASRDYSKSQDQA